MHAALAHGIPTITISQIDFTLVNSIFKVTSALRAGSKSMVQEVIEQQQQQLSNEMMIESHIDIDIDSIVVAPLVARPIAQQQQTAAAAAAAATNNNNNKSNKPAASSSSSTTTNATTTTSKSSFLFIIRYFF